MDKPIKFSNPPVVEVACGILFSNPDFIKTVHLGSFWELIKKDYPRFEDAPPLDPVVESVDSYSQQIDGALFSHLPPLRRAWFFSEDGRNLIQLQNDRFLFNWKRAEDDDSYPSYDNVIKQFEEKLQIFIQFCKDSKIDVPEYRQYELVYVNHISSKNGLNILPIDKLFVDHTRSETRDRFLKSPCSVNWITSYQLPESSGRLHVTIQSAFAVSNKEEVVRMDLVARGIPNERTEEARKRWFSMAHEWITRGFADLTAEELHSDKNWKRTL